MTRKTGGFTLIELLTVILIISILLSITSLVVMNVREKVMIQRTLSLFTKIDVALASYKMVYNEYPPNKAAVPTTLNGAGVLCVSGECLWYFLAMSFAPHHTYDPADPKSQLNIRYATTAGGPFDKEMTKEVDIFDYVGKFGLDAAANGHYSVCDSWNQPLVYNRNPTLDVYREDTGGAAADTGKVDENDLLYLSTTAPHSSNWGQYIPNIHNEQGADIYSAGPSGVYEDGTGDDDLNNWTDYK